MKSQVIGNYFGHPVQSAEQVAEAEAEYERRLEEQQRQMRLSSSATEGPSPDEILEDAPKRVNQTYRRERPKLGRNDPCWCGSGKSQEMPHGTRPC